MDNIKALKKIGFSPNESKVYLALLKDGVLNGYEISKRSGVARSLVYGVLDRLCEKRAVEVIPGEIKLYKPVEYNTLLDRMSDSYSDSINEAKKGLASIAASGGSPDFVFNINGFEQLLSEAENIIDEAEIEISICVWSEELEMLKGALIAALKRGVNVYLFSYSLITEQFTENFTYNITDPENLFVNRRLMIVADKKHLLLGENGKSASSVGIMTENKSIVNLANDGFILDIYNYKTLKSKNYLSDKMTADEFIAISDKNSKEIGVYDELSDNKRIVRK